MGKGNGLVFTEEQLKNLGLMQRIIETPAFKRPIIPGVEFVEEPEIKEEPETDKFLIGNKWVFAKYVFHIDPMGAPRMSQSDKWKTVNNPDLKKRQRPVVTRYFAYRNSLIQQAAKMGYEIGETVRMIAIIRMPDSWGKKTKAIFYGKPHQSKPDADNVFKGFSDSLAKEDKNIWHIEVIKIWGHEGKIIIF